VVKIDLDELVVKINGVATELIGNKSISDISHKVLDKKEEVLKVFGKLIVTLRNYYAVGNYDDFEICYDKGDALLIKIKKFSKKLIEAVIAQAKHVKPDIKKKAKDIDKIEVMVGYREIRGLPRQIEKFEVKFKGDNIPLSLSDFTGNDLFDYINSIMLHGLFIENFLKEYIEKAKKNKPAIAAILK